MNNLFNRRAPRIVILSGMAAALCCAQEARAQQSASQESGSQESAGAALYKNACASCHDSAAAQAPRLEVLRQMSPERVVESLLYGSMPFVRNVFQAGAAARRRPLRGGQGLRVRGAADSTLF